MDRSAVTYFGTSRRHDHYNPHKYAIFPIIFIDRLF